MNVQVERKVEEKSPKQSTAKVNCLLTSKVQATDSHVVYWTRHAPDVGSVPYIVKLSRGNYESINMQWQKWITILHSKWEFFP